MAGSAPNVPSWGRSVAIGGMESEKCCDWWWMQGWSNIRMGVVMSVDGFVKEMEMRQNSSKLK